MAKLIVMCDNMSGTGIEAVKGDSVELELTDDNLKLVNNGWLALEAEEVEDSEEVTAPEPTATDPTKDEDIIDDEFEKKSKKK